jgi:hypothetical protein
MKKRERQVEDYESSGIPRWIKWILVGFIALVMIGLGFRDYQSSQVVLYPQYRFNIAIIGIDSGVTFVSYDPAERSILTIPFPNDLAINSRTSGEYSISSLYKLGSYKGQGGMFARQKIQGFMRVPVPGYLVVNKVNKVTRSQLIRNLVAVMLHPKSPDSSLSRLDAALLLYRTSRYSLREVGEDELIRAGVINNKTYYPERLQEYVGSRLFDWGIGATGITVAITNASGENGLGSDMADFLSNLGFDVVMVRSTTSKELLENTEWQVSNEGSAKKLGYIFQNLFGLDNPKIENVPSEYRSEVFIQVGKDAKDLF